MKTLKLIKRHELRPIAAGQGWRSSTDARPADRELASAFPEVISLPSDRPRPATSYRGAAETMAVPGDLVDALDDVGGLVASSDVGAPPPTILATFAVLLHRYSGDDRMVVGVSTSTRGPEIRGGEASLLIGALPLRIELDNDPRFRELTEKVGRGYREFRDDPGRLPGATMSRGLRAHAPRDDISRCQVELHVSAGPVDGGYRTLGLPNGFVPLDPARAGNELRLVMVRRGRELDCTFEYNTELFDSATVRRMLGHFEVLLRAALANPGERISELPLITESERRQLVEEWNQPAPGAPPPSSSQMLLHEKFEEQASRTPDRVAIVFGGRTLTYREVDARSNQVAHALRRRGVGPDKLVGISLERSPELVVGLLGILKAGAAFVPLEPSYPAERLVALLAETQPALLVTDSRLLASCRCDSMPSFRMDREREALAAESSAAPGVRLTDEHLATVMFSSGSTGKPKAISRSHRSICPSASMRSIFQLDESDRHVFKTSLDSTLLGREVFWPLTTGGRMIIAGPHENSDTLALLRLLIDYKITILTLVPSLLRLLVAEDGFADCVSLRHVTCFGETLAADVEESFCTKLSAQLSIYYGTTEAPALALRQTGRGRPRPLGNLGHRSGNVEIYVLDKRLRPVPIGVPGELFASGPVLARGYLNLPEQTKERFVPHPFSRNPGARLYRTGDLARWRSDESLEFLGRLDDQIKVRGYRVEPAEVEAALARHTAIREVVVGIRANSTGENQLVAYLVQKTEQLTAGELRTFLKQRLPDHMVPTTFVRVPKIPRTPNGKIDRQGLPGERFERLGSPEPDIAPRTPVEDVMAGIWCGVLDISAVGTNDNFFDLGGHSLLVTRLLTRVKDVFGVALTPTALLQAPTVRQLAAAVLTRDQPTSDTIFKLQSGELAPPFFCFPSADGKNGQVLSHPVMLAALARHIGPGYPFYGVTHGTLPDDLEADRLIETLAVHAIAEIRAVRPHGPYLLGGYSLGGLIALEVARRLRAEGEEIPLLAFLDAFGPGFPKSPGIVEIIRMRFEELSSLSFRERARKVAEQIRSRLMRYHGIKRFARNGSSDLPTLMRIGRTSYLDRLERYPGRINLFRPSLAVSVPGLDDDPMNGWDGFAEQGVRVCEIPGRHESMLDPPNLPTLAEAIRSRIRDTCC
jgi:amino acid adenylation domain-containing protein